MKSNFDKRNYKPSTEEERKRQEKARNIGRKRAYKTRLAKHNLPSVLTNQAI